MLVIFKVKSVFQNYPRILTNFGRNLFFQWKMSIFSNFFNSDVPKIDSFSLPHSETLSNFVEIYRFFINPLTISQNFILIQFFVKKLLKRKPLGVHSTPLGWVRVKIYLILTILFHVYFLYRKYEPFGLMTKN